MKHVFETGTDFTISSNVKRTPKIDGVRFHSIKNHVLGKNYELSMVFVGKTLGRRLNYEHRKKDYVTDVLSFPLDQTAGEIFINLDKCRSKAKLFDRKFENYLYFIFIHALHHLKGFDHGSTMENKEARVRALFNI